MDGFLNILKDLGLNIGSDIGGFALLIIAALLVQAYRYARKNIDWFVIATEWFNITKNEDNFRRWAYQAAEELYERYLSDLDSEEEGSVEEYLDAAVERAITKYAPNNFEWADLNEEHVKSIIRKHWRDMVREK